MELELGEKLLPGQVVLRICFVQVATHVDAPEELQLPQGSCQGPKNHKLTAWSEVSYQPQGRSSSPFVLKCNSESRDELVNKARSDFVVGGEKDCCPPGLSSGRARLGRSGCNEGARKELCIPTFMFRLPFSLREEHRPSLQGCTNEAEFALIDNTGSTGVRSVR